MNTHAWHVLRRATAALGLAASACGAPASPPAEGRLLVSTPCCLHELPSSPTATDPGRARLAGPGVLGAALSPDARHLVYTQAMDGLYDSVDASGRSFRLRRTGHETRLLDLRTRQAEVLFQGAVDCLSWSTDSRAFSYVSSWPGGHGLYVYDLATRRPTPISTPPREVYAGGGSRGRTYYGEVDCGRWLAPDRLLFDRYVGPMPSVLQLPDTRALEANTTTLAALGDTVRLTDLPARASVLDVSAEAQRALLLWHERGETDLRLVQGVRELDDLRTDYLLLRRRWAATDEYRARLTGNAIAWGRSDPFRLDAAVEFLDLATQAVSRGPTLPGDWVQWTWVGDPRDGVYAAVRRQGPDAYDLWLTNLARDNAVQLAGGRLAAALAQECTQMASGRPQLVG